ncbi:hypothetical protein BC829DRAFT_258886 [Chytridium lagenaria]|nr:hypothetical protein BC829DRAFT_258886 [Chytridium lagenaria]
MKVPHKPRTKYQPPTPLPKPPRPNRPLKSYSSLHTFRTPESLAQCRLYSLPPHNILEIFHTHTPRRHRGNGHAETVTLQAFNYAKQRNWKVWPTCSYVAETFLERRKELREM